METNMKVYYLFAPVEKENVGPGSGVERKVRSQYRSLNEYIPCELVILPPATYKGTTAEKIYRRLPFTAAWRRWKYRGEFDDADFLYIRQVYHDDSFTRYLRDIKRKNPSVKIIYEVPTYPYDDERGISSSRSILTLKERIGRKKAAAYMDRIVTFYDQEEIWGVPCLKLINGYDFSKVELPKRELSDTIHILSVAANAFWHGYDRFLKGLGEYYRNGGKEKIVYHLVGDILPEYRNLVSDYGLQDHVVLYGRKSGKELEELYKKCLLGIDFLGGHRKNFPVSSSLKSREYAAYGLPLITSSPVDYLPRDYRYQLLVPYDDSPIDMKKVISFYHGIYDILPPETVAWEFRNYAKNLCDMKVTMKPVADWIIGSSGSGDS
jgi:hypothetical protein